MVSPIPPLPLENDLMQTHGLRARSGRVTLLNVVVIAAVTATVVAAPMLLGVVRGADTPRSADLGAPKVSATPPVGRAYAVLAGGCFWAMQEEFQKLKGVDKVVAGYAGGSVPNPSYERVCTGVTGHAESVEITFDPKVISYTDLLRIYFTDIDPTTLNRQGPDDGTQYRSAIFYRDAAQRNTAIGVVKEITEEKIYGAPIVTQVKPFTKFYPAENYHQKYCEHNSDNSYCANVVTEEVDRFVKMNKARLKP